MSARTEQVLIEDLSRLPPARAGDPFNFINSVLDFLTRWCSTYSVSISLADEAYCCFVGFERVTAAVHAAGSFEECPFFRDDTPQDLLGKIYFCSSTCTAVFSRKGTFKNLGQCHAVIDELRAVDRPMVIFNAAERTVLWRVAKKAEIHQAVLRPQPVPKLTSEDFDKALEDFHYEYTATPQGLTKPWENAGKLLTKLDLEQEIRDDLFVYLRFLMQEPFAVQREFFGAAGRSDLFVYFYLEKRAIYVELKVLRAFVKKGKYRVAVPAQEAAERGSEGIAQASDYKKSNRDVGVAYACCFDARSENLEIEELVHIASQLNVEYRRFFMYQSAALLHEATMKSAGNN